MNHTPYLRRDEPNAKDFRFARSWAEAAGPHATCYREDFQQYRPRPSKTYYVCLLLVCIAYLAAIAYLVSVYLPL